MFKQRGMVQSPMVILVIAVIITTFVIMTMTTWNGTTTSKPKKPCNYKVGDVVQTYTGGHITQVLKVNKGSKGCIYKVRTIDFKARWIHEFEVQERKE